jgi:hypothetical protein
MIRQLRRQGLRTLTMLLGVLLATSGFTLLTGAVQTSQLRVTGVVDQNYRSAYDILVRPVGARTGTEQAGGQVRPNFLSGQFGGITTEQWRRILGLPGVDVAAPVAMAGYTQVTASTVLDLTDQVDRGAERQLLRVGRTWHTDRGLSTFDDPGQHYVYVTRNEVVLPEYTIKDGTIHLVGYRHRGRIVPIDLRACGYAGEPIARPLAEALPDGRLAPICPTKLGVAFGNTGLGAADRSRLDVFQLLPDGGFVSRDGAGLGERVRRPRLTIRITWPMALLLAAIDPAQEARLVGLDAAVVSGRYLLADDRPRTRGDRQVWVPILASAAPQVDESLTADVSQVRQPPALTGVAETELWARLAALPSRPVTTLRADAADAYRAVGDPAGLRVNFNRLVRSGHPEYLDGDVLRPRPVPVDADRMWRQDHQFSTDDSAPLFAHDLALRSLTRLGELAPPAARWRPRRSSAPSTPPG